ncbi:MAG: SUF system NifU family Fe-S cluster assembly protein [Planctomycetes bacterium]|nr:SUF system NifU family Fe-S cluster assembly protein [Planctomycetota bacterium]MBI3844925.1 SUF system NifU family Fe-S cluster assembly protein [Planctomycetota bacterium]
MSDLRDLYQEVILDHSKKPRNCRKLEGPSCSAKGHNPLCGDRITVYANVKDGVIQDLSFEGAGCAISTASASMMTESLKGKSVADVKALFDTFHALVTEEKPPKGVSLGKLEAFAGVREFPMRVKCATLAWHTLNAALENRGEPVSTE